MRTKGKKWRFGATLAAALTLGGLPAQTPDSSSAQDSLSRGRELFVRHCAPCHGVAGKGDGPAAGAQKTPPPDLTRIQEPGGRFDSARVMDIVEGSKVIEAHGSRSMPVWGVVFRNREGYSKAQEILHDIVRYLESIQENRP